MNTALLSNLTPREQNLLMQVAELLVARRENKESNSSYSADDVSVKELLLLTTYGDTWKWLDNPEEDVYSLNDGDDAVWPSAK